MPVICSPPPPGEVAGWNVLDMKSEKARRIKVCVTTENLTDEEKMVLRNHIIKNVNNYSNVIHQELDVEIA